MSGCKTYEDLQQIICFLQQKIINVEESYFNDQKNQTEIISIIDTLLNFVQYCDETIGPVYEQFQQLKLDLKQLGNEKRNLFLKEQKFKYKWNNILEQCFGVSLDLQLETKFEFNDDIFKLINQRKNDCVDNINVKTCEEELVSVPVLQIAETNQQECSHEILYLEKLTKTKFVSDDDSKSKRHLISISNDKIVGEYQNGDVHSITNSFSNFFKINDASTNRNHLYDEESTMNQTNGKAILMTTQQPLHKHCLNNLNCLEEITDTNLNKTTLPLAFRSNFILSRK